MFNPFRKKTKGCLYGKTQEEKEDYFEGLSCFILTDYEFFKEQYEDLLPHEQGEFNDYVIHKGRRLKMIKLLLDCIEKLSKKGDAENLIE